MHEALQEFLIKLQKSDRELSKIKDEMLTNIAKARKDYNIWKQKNKK